MTRTVQQNRAIHKYLALIAAKLNAEDISVTMVIKPDTVWTVESAKELMWRPVQQALTGRSSSTKLTTEEVTAVYDSVNKILGERFGIHEPFPSNEKDYNG